AVPQACLEIHTGMMASAFLTDTILCSSLAVDDGGSNVAQLESSSGKSPSRVAS
ncbi:MAG: DUF1830 domain-containing protein, partial [Cyanobacteria bacterium J06555_12]